MKQKQRKRNVYGKRKMSRRLDLSAQRFVDSQQNATFWTSSSKFHRKKLYIPPLLCLWIVNFFMAETASENAVEVRTLLRQEDFEGAYITWNDGGSDANIVESGGKDDTRAMRLRDNTGSSTTTLATALTEASSYDKIRVKFWFRTRRFQHGEDFWLQASYDNGNTWNNEADWIKGTNFDNNVQYNGEAEFSPKPEGTEFPSTLRLRFRCDASSNRDQVFLDNIQIYGVKAQADTESPTTIRSQYPSESPSASPSALPSSLPSGSPTSSSSSFPPPSVSPTTSTSPSSVPSASRSSSLSPSILPSTSFYPSSAQSAAPTATFRPSSLSSISARPTDHDAGSQAPTSSRVPSIEPKTSTEPSSVPNLSSFPSTSSSRPSVPSKIPSLSHIPSHGPSSEPEPKTREDICPIDRKWSLPSKYYLLKNGTKFSEISGLAFSEQTYKGHRIAYVAEDKGSNSKQDTLQAIYFHYNSTTNIYVGELLASLKLDLTLDDTEMPDWENLSMGPCDDALQMETCIYVGNTGNNDAHYCTSTSCTVGQEQVKIYKFKEINWSSTSVSAVVPGGEITIANVATILLEYSSDFPAARNDAEAMFVDFTGDKISGDRKGDIYLFTKNPNDRTQRRIGKVGVTNHATLSDGTTSDVITIEMVGRTYKNYVFTGGDMSPDGRLIALRTGKDIYYFPRVMGTSVVTSLDFDIGATPCSWTAPTSIKLVNENKYESVAFVSSSTIAELSECDDGTTCDVPVYFYDLIFPSTKISTPPENPNGSIVKTLTYDEFQSSSWSNSNWMIDSKNSDSSKPVLVNNIAGIGKCSSSYKARISNNNGISSSFYHETSHDCSGYDRILVSFDFFTNDSYEKLDDFFLEYSYDDGAHWMIVEDWTRSAGFFMNEEECYSTKVHIDKYVGNGLPSLSGTMKLRFRSNASSSTDKVYLMNILVEGVTFNPTT